MFLFHMLESAGYRMSYHSRTNEVIDHTYLAVSLPAMPEHKSWRAMREVLPRGMTSQSVIGRLAITITSPIAIA